MPSNNLHKVNYNIPNNYNKVNKMRHLQIKTCFFYDKPDHFTKGCADLAIIKHDLNFSNYINSPKKKIILLLLNEVEMKNMYY